MKSIYLILLIFFISACAQLPPTPQDIQAKKFEAVPGQAVIYIVRPVVDGRVSGPLSFSGTSDSGMISTEPGTYYRWETAPGTLRVEAFGASTASVTVQAEAGKIYFIEHTAHGSIRNGLQYQGLRRIDENRGRHMVNAAQLL